MRIENKIVDGWAEAVLAELNKTRYIRFPQGISTSSAMMLSSNNQNTADELMSSTMSVYPNPSDGDIIIAFKEAKEALGYIIDATGRKVRTVSFNENKLNYEVNGLSHGLYSVVIHYIDGKVESKQLIIK